ncbi:hypothetical protein N8T08_009298 [Aspergillus melleus]|uniref:Uncharacterized protein n=1 Tax=Aspergillus melleus TaxID=138277 RepID=A0ACC3AUR6_9EURO|nr:hypothetical protein N8T08_009298 [Aspergillus melleus]
MHTFSSQDIPDLSDQVIIVTGGNAGLGYETIRQLSQLLLPILRETAKLNRQARMVMLSSAAHARAPSDVYKFDELRTPAAHRHTTERYTTSKLGNLHYARALAERESGFKIIPVHPGMVATNLHHALTGTFLKPFLYAAIFLGATSVEKGALSQIFAAVSPDAKHGQYYGPIGKAESGSKLSQNHDIQEVLFKWIQGQLSTHVGPIP